MRVELTESLPYALMTWHSYIPVSSKATRSNLKVSGSESPFRNCKPSLYHFEYRGKLP